MNESNPDCGWVKLFHPKGPQVTIPVTAKALDYGAMFANVTAMLDAGFLASAPGLDAGEEKEQIGWVLRGAFEKEGETTPFVLLYAASEALTWSILKVYLNTPADVAAFEYASKMKLDALPDYVGNDKPQRGAGRKTDEFIRKAPKPFGVVFKPNPKHDPNTEEGKMKPARLFVRWEDQKPQGDESTVLRDRFIRSIEICLTDTSLRSVMADIKAHVAKLNPQHVEELRAACEKKRGTFSPPAPAADRNTKPDARLRCRELADKLGYDGAGWKQYLSDYNVTDFDKAAEPVVAIILRDLTEKLKESKAAVA